MEHPTTVLVLTFIIIFSGVLSYFAIPRESNPEITIPNIIVNTVYTGVSPRDIELLITRPIEDHHRVIPALLDELSRHDRESRRPALEESPSPHAQAARI